MLERFKEVPLSRLLVGLVAFIVLVVGTKAAIEFVPERPDSGRYQAVFLTNGQVYFGKLSGLGGAYVTLKDVYLVQSQGSVVNPSPGPQSRLTISRLDQNALIHPEQEMIISRNSMLFWENMQNDAEVVEKIKELKKDKK